MTLKLTFHGAAGCVTGSCARLETPAATVLIDCGMFQGSKTLKALNYADFPFDAEKVDAVLLTHAHIDHSGLAPKLVKAGCRSPIFATAASRDLCEVMLRDAADIQESEVRQLNRRNQQRGLAEVAPIYSPADVERTMAAFREVRLHEPVQVGSGVTATWWSAGHIVGAASIEVTVDAADGPVSLLFSGDVGAGGREYVADPEGPAGVDHLILESTYGDRERPALDDAARRGLLAAELNAAHEAGGPLLVPAFAVERAQELLAEILQLTEDGRAPPCDIFLDSPLAIEATEVFRARGWNADRGANPFAILQRSARLRFLRSPAESDQLERLRGWHIIMAGSGMCDAGRVRRHLKRLLWRTQATVLLSGYQATGTLGRYLQDGAREVSIQGETVRVRARVRMLDAYSAHADARGLVQWAQARGPVRGAVFLVHGEPAGRAGLAARLAGAGFATSRLRCPELDEVFELTADGATGHGPGPRRLAPPEVSRADWHNARARLLMRLNDELAAAPDDRARERILARLAQALGGDAAGTTVPAAEAPAGRARDAAEP